MQNLGVPRHLGIIPDGNRRWAKARALQPWKGHEEGRKKFEEILKWCEELGIRMVTFYTVSSENLSRPKEEVDFLMNLLKVQIKKMLEEDSDVHKKRVRVRIIGDKSLLDNDLQQLIGEIETATKNYSDYYLNLAIAYGGRAEILDATKRIAQRVKDGKMNIDEINEKTFSESLYAELPDVDLIIRTSEQRTSGFLTWQSTYSEIVFLPDMLFPDLKKEDFVKAIEEFSSRERRFGK
jgi:tritrans,polycis-undecaprenyl-diphosphate synthase [geranylgeranyl-diphosphate specific]